jgi:hypothetical protein
MIRKHYEELIIKYRADLDSDHSLITEHIIGKPASIFELSHGEIINRLMFFGYDEIKKIHDAAAADNVEVPNVKDYSVLHLFDENAQNSEVFDKAKALAAVKKAAHKYHDERNEVRTSFHELFAIIYKQRKWNSAIFKEKTLLDDTIHSKLKNRKSYKPSKRTILAIAVGAGLDIKTTEELFLAAGYSGENACCNPQKPSVYYE